MALGKVIYVKKDLGRKYSVIKIMYLSEEEENEYEKNRYSYNFFTDIFMYI